MLVIRWPGVVMWVLIIVLITAIVIIGIDSANSVPKGGMSYHVDGKGSQVAIYYDKMENVVCYLYVRDISCVKRGD